MVDLFVKVHLDDYSSFIRDRKFIESVEFYADYFKNPAEFQDTIRSLIKKRREQNEQSIAENEDSEMASDT